MSRRRSSNAGSRFVPHPRYGSDPIPSAHKVAEDEIRRGHWRLRDARIFPETVLPADPGRQNYSLYPRTYYVDMERICRICQRPFLFFAQEQRHWFETLRIFVDADCVRCPVCRRESRAVSRRLQRYAVLHALAVPSRKDFMFMVDDAVFLVQRGVLSHLDRVGALKNRAARVIPEYPGLAVLAALLAAKRAQVALSDEAPAHPLSDGAPPVA